MREIIIVFFVGIAFVIAGCDEPPVVREKVVIYTPKPKQPTVEPEPPKPVPNPPTPESKLPNPTFKNVPSIKALSQRVDKVLKREVAIVEEAHKDSNNRFTKIKKIRNEIEEMYDELRMNEAQGMDNPIPPGYSKAVVDGKIEAIKTHISEIEVWVPKVESATKVLSDLDDEIGKALSDLNDKSSKLALKTSSAGNDFETLKKITGLLIQLAKLKRQCSESVRSANARHYDVQSTLGYAKDYLGYAQTSAGSLETKKKEYDAKVAEARKRVAEAKKRVAELTPKLDAVIEEFKEKSKHFYDAVKNTLTRDYLDRFSTRKIMIYLDVGYIEYEIPSGIHYHFSKNWHNVEKLRELDRQYKDLKKKLEEAKKEAGL